MKINRFKKISANKYKIFINDKTLILYDEIILKYNLLYKKEIDNDLLLLIEKDNYKASIYDIALKYIGVRMRSVKEIKEYLLKKEFNINEVDEVINKLLNQNLLNDKIFAKSYINDKLNLTNSGLDKIQNELLKLGVEEDIIDKEIKTIDVNIIKDKLKNIINKELKINNKLPLLKIRNKILNKCITLGYKLEDINEILSNMDVTSSSDIKKEYNKLYNKYKTKYEKYKLESTIKSKLYQKGYTIEEINNIFDN